MKFLPDTSTSVVFDEVLVFAPSVGKDDRGEVFTTYRKKFYDEFLPRDLEFNQDKFSISEKDVLRGLHGDEKTWKLVTCLHGEIFQVIADMRPASDTFLSWDSWVINPEGKLQILVPPGFVNGYYTLTDEAIYHYKLAYEGEYTSAKDQRVIKWDDERLGISWPCSNPILQERDE